MRFACLGWIPVLLSCAAPSALTRAESRPNIVFVLIDDLRWDDLGCTGHPFVKTPNIDRIAQEGALFRNAFATTPLCSPSRASFLTGLYAHANGITDNTDRSAHSHTLDIFPRRLQQAGYETAFVGKWHMGNEDKPRPGFDYWVGMPGQGNSYDSVLNENGVSAKSSGYITDVLTDRAVGFLKRPRSAPFLLYLAHKAVHPELPQRADGTVDRSNGSNYIPAERHKRLYADCPIPRRPNALKAPEGKPALQRKIGDLPALGPETGTTDESIRGRLRMLAAVDEGMQRIFQALEQTGRLDNTLIVFTGDHGYFYGEHGLDVERRLAYEETIRIPLLLRYPPLLRPGRTFDATVLGIDLAPTLLELGGAKAPPMHGRSLVPLLKGETQKGRPSIMIEYYSDSVWPRMVKMGYKAARTDRYKYIRYTELQGMDELYDLVADPYEMKNLIGEAAAQPALARMKAELEKLLKETQ